MKTLYVVLGAVTAIIIVLKLHINLRFLILPYAAAIFYLYRTELYGYWKNHALPYAQSRGLKNFHDSSPAVKGLYILLGSVPAIAAALKLHINLKLLIFPLAAAVCYLYRTAIYGYWKNSALPHALSGGLAHWRASPPAAKIFYSILAAVPVLLVALKLHVNIKWLLVFLAAAVLFIALPELHAYYKGNALFYGQNPVAETHGEVSLTTKIQYVALGVILGFIVAFELHIKFLMYPLAAAIFYLYVPLLYVYGRKSALQNARNGEPAEYYSYLWFTAWFVVTCIFSYMLSHLLADLIDSFHWSFFRYLLYGFIFLMAAGLAYIGYLQWSSKKIELLGDIKTNFEKQGRLAGFEILFTLLVYFLIKH